MPQVRANRTLCDEIGMRAWCELLDENTRNPARLVAVLRGRLARFRPWPYGQRPIERPLSALVDPPYRGDALRLLDSLRSSRPLGVTAQSFEPFQFRR
jgi:hypothetical protein